MRILICDDDTLIIEQLQKYIESYFESNHLKCPELVSFTSGESLLADKNEKDIVFLDIEMPGMNGIYVGNELKKANKNVLIFVVTSYSEYLDEAMRFHVFRYLSKPLDKQRFFRNMKDALTYYNSITTKIPVETKQGVYSFPASQIIAIEAQERKVIVHTARQDFDSIHNMESDEFAKMPALAQPLGNVSNDTMKGNTVSCLEMIVLKRGVIRHRIIGKYIFGNYGT